VRELVRSSAPELGPKIRICTAGVDARFWAPSGVGRSSRVVVYWKSGDEAFCTDVERVIEASGLQPIRIRYGKYTPDEYKRALDNAVAGVFLSSFETQGLALAEAWSMDVPTLVWNPQAQTSWRGHPFVAGSSAPYLSVETGSSWRRVSELASLIDDLPQKRHEFHPRDWVLANMSDVVCSAALFAIIERESRGRTHSTPPVVAVSG